MRVKKVTDGLRTWIRLHLYKAPNMERSLTGVADEIDAQVQAMPILHWHAMADERPENITARYLLLGNGGGLYVGRISTLRCANGMTSFHIPNHRDVYMLSNKIKAWAEIPEYMERP